MACSARAGSDDSPLRVEGDVAALIEFESLDGDVDFGFDILTLPGGNDRSNLWPQQLNVRCDNALNSFVEVLGPVTRFRITDFVRASAKDNMSGLQIGRNFDWRDADGERLIG